MTEAMIITLFAALILAIIKAVKWWIVGRGLIPSHFFLLIYFDFKLNLFDSWILTHVSIPFKNSGQSNKPRWGKLILILGFHPVQKFRSIKLVYCEIQKPGRKSFHPVQKFRSIKLAWGVVYDWLSRVSIPFKNSGQSNFFPAGSIGSPDCVSIPFKNSGQSNLWWDSP